MSAEYAFIFEKESCIECFGCVGACKSWQGVPAGVAYRRVLRIWTGSYPDVAFRSVSVGCMHCVSPDCIEACPESAITKRPGDGVVLVDRDKCIGCRACGEACPCGAPQFGDDDKMRKCDLCSEVADPGSEDPACVATCPTGAIRLARLSPEEKNAEASRIKAMIAP